jgi:hypothetical protein
MTRSVGRAKARVFVHREAAKSESQREESATPSHTRSLSGTNGGIAEADYCPTGWKDLVYNFK